jgi:hypothetical protein
MCLRSPKAVLGSSLPWTAAEFGRRRHRIVRSASDGAAPTVDAAHIDFAQSINDSLSDAAFTMELGECDVEDNDFESEADAVPTASCPYTQSPYCYSFCGFDGENEDERILASRGWTLVAASQRTEGSLDDRRRRLAARMLFSNTNSSESEMEANQAPQREAKESSNSNGTMTVNAERVNAHATHSTQKSAEGTETQKTPTNIEDGIHVCNFAHTNKIVSQAVKNADLTDLSHYYKQHRSGLRRNVSDPGRLQEGALAGS